MLFLHDFRQYLIFWRNRLHVVCYESSAGAYSAAAPDHLSRSSTAADLPVDHNFSFRKVDLDSYGLKQRHHLSKKNGHNPQGILTSSDDDSDSGEKVPPFHLSPALLKHQKNMKSGDTISVFEALSS